MKESRHSLRVVTDLDNPITLDLKGCGQLYVLPNKEYFFENAPIKFIDYVASLKKLNVSYKLTKDKKGCFRTIDLTQYAKGNPMTAMQNFRGGFTPVSNVVEESTTPKVDPTDPPEDEFPDLIPDGTFNKEIDEIELKNLQTSDVPEGQLTVDDYDENGNLITPEGEGTPATEGTGSKETTGENEGDQEKEPEAPVDYMTLNKADLIEYAHSLGLTEVSDIDTKKNIREAVANKLAE